MTLKNATLASSMHTGTVNVPHGLHYVTKVAVTASANGIEISVTLDQQRQFLVSASQVPPQLTLAIG
jgi:hypothetical protein